jgi:hypothetical protein
MGEPPSFIISDIELPVTGLGRSAGARQYPENRSCLIADAESSSTERHVLAGK